MEHPAKGVLASSFEREDELARQAVKGAKARTSAAQALIPTLQEETLVGQNQLRADAARGLQLSLGQAGGVPIGGGLSASLRQTALERGLESAQFGSQQARLVNQARTGAATALSEQAQLEQGILSAQTGRAQQEMLSLQQFGDQLQADGINGASIAIRLRSMPLITPEGKAEAERLARFYDPEGGRERVALPQVGLINRGVSAVARFLGL